MATFLSQVPGTRDDVVLVKNPGAPDKQGTPVRANIQSNQGMFEVETPIDVGDVIELPDPRGGLRSLTVREIKIYDAPGGMSNTSHITATWGPAALPRVAAIRRLGLEGLHTDILLASSDLFADGHYSATIFEAFTAVEVRVRRMSGLDASGKQLMGAVFSGSPPPIRLSAMTGRSGEEEQDGLKLLFIGAAQGIRNPKAHDLVQQFDPQRALEYLPFAGLLMRRLDDAEQLARGTPAG